MQPKHSTIPYRKPGDALDIAVPALFDVAAKKRLEIENTLFPNAYSLAPPVWWNGKTVAPSLSSTISAATRCIV